MPTVHTLIVENEHIIARDLAQKLTGLGYIIVAIATSGQAAIDSARTQHPDLVLMDVGLPGHLDGMAVFSSSSVPSSTGNPSLKFTTGCFYTEYTELRRTLTTRESSSLVPWAVAPGAFLFSCFLRPPTPARSLGHLRSFA